jgi:Glycosyl hydrolase catalytic core
MRRLRVAAIIATLIASAAPSSALAADWGIGDQGAGTFDNPLFTALHVRRTRLVTTWDSVLTEPATLDQWLTAARVSGLTPLVAFNHSKDDICAAPCRAPSAHSYRHALEVFHRRFPWVTELSPWNEANHGDQPTARRPELAARYFAIAHSVCRGCTLVAADVLDSSNMVRWMRRFLRAARVRPSVIGLHNYSDVNRRRTRGTDELLRMTHAQVWLTETGGIVSLRAKQGDLDAQERNAGAALDFLFDLVLRRPRIKRVYLYQWRRLDPYTNFDAGLLRPDGTPRPSYFVACRRLPAARCQ